MSKILRPYQEKCHEVVEAKYNSGVMKQLIVLFTGAGKSYLLIKLIERMGFKRVLWLSYQEQLVEQSAMAFIHDKFDDKFYNHVNDIGFINYVKDSGSWYGMSGFTIGCIKAEVFKPDGNVVMGSVMTVHKRLNKIEPDFYDLIICDEAHLYGSKSASDILSYFKPKLLIGATATPHRENGLMMGDVFDEITFNYGLGEGIKDGWCAELDAIRVKTNVNLDKVKVTAGDLNQGDLANEINTLARNQLIVTKWKEYAIGRQTIAFCVNIKHAIDLAEVFKANGVNAVAVSSNEELTPDRSENIKLFKAGKIDVLVNVNVLVAGFDHPNTGCAIMACPTKSLTKYLQAVGRAARLKSTDYVSKFGQNALILDITDVTSRHNLINAWELDKKKPLEERCFISQEKKDKILEERENRARLEHERREDERVKLLQLPDIIKFKSDKMKEAATPAQLKWLNDLGYDVINNNFTKQMCSDIIGMQPCNQKEIEYLKSKGYDTQFATKGHYSTVYFEHEMKGKKWK